jgi:hypothetical protein
LVQKGPKSKKRLIAYVSDDGTPETRFLHKDHLGSITTIISNTNWAGAREARLRRLGEAAQRYGLVERGRRGE